MSVEAGVLVGVDLNPIIWHLPPNRNVGALPDSRDLWETMWEHRKTILGFAHSHPGSGVPGPSGTDVTTFRAVEKALGRQIVWWICSDTHIVVCRQIGHGNYWEATEFEGENLLWLPELRRLSHYPPQFSDLVCRGSYTLGTACGDCEECAKEESTLKAKGQWPPPRRFRKSPSYQKMVDELQQRGASEWAPSAVAIAMLDEGFSTGEAAYAVSVLHGDSPPDAAALVADIKRSKDEE